MSKNLKKYLKKTLFSVYRVVGIKAVNFNKK